MSGEEESGQFSGAEDNDLEDTRGRPMQKTDTNDDSRTGSSSGHSSGHMSHQTEISGNNLLRKITKKVLFYLTLRYKIFMLYFFRKKEVESSP